MFGNLKIKAPDLSRTIYSNSNIGRVDVADDENIEKWASVLGISESELLVSIDEFGSVVADIRRGRKLKAG